MKPLSTSKRIIPVLYEKIQLLELQLKNAKETLMMAAAQTSYWADQSERYDWDKHQVKANRALSKLLAIEASHIIA